ncbi:MAG: hypothetical protein ACO1OD_02470 [Croceibacterium sp.]
MLDDDQSHIPLVVKYETSGIWPDMRDLLGVSRTGAAIGVALYEAHQVGKAVSYSRSRKYYDERNTHPLLTYKRTRNAVDSLDDLGLIDHFRQLPGVRGRQSAMKATPKLIARVETIVAAHGNLPLEMPRRGIILHDDERRPVALPQTRELARMNSKVVSINEVLLSADVREDSGLLLSAPVVRIFNRTLARGGRLYAQGASWQNMARLARSAVTINGEAVVELDFATLHPAMLYAEAGAPLPVDCYALPGWDRKLVKLGLLILINARNVASARMCIAHRPEMDAADEQYALRQASMLIGAIKAAHRPIAWALHSDAGARLMRKDSEIAKDVLLKLNSQGIIALPLHDSFLVPKSKRNELETAMHEAAYHAGLRAVRVGEVV